NCHLLARFDTEGELGLLELGAPSASQANLLYDETDAFSDERLAGVLLFDDPNGSTASWSGGPPPAPNGTYVTQTGPAVYRIHVASRSQKSGPAGSTDFVTSTFYTVIADGRIIRDDDVGLTSAPTSADWLLSYIALAAQHFTDVRWVGSDAGAEETDIGGTPFGPVPIRETTTGALDWACVYNDSEAFAVGVGIFDKTSSKHAPVGPRATRVHHQTRDVTQTSITLQSDWVRGPGTVDPSEYPAETLMHVGAYEGEPCDTIDAYHRAYQGAGTLVWDTGYIAWGEVSGGEGSSGTHFSPGGGFYWVAAPETITENIVVHLQDAEPQPTMLLYVAQLDEASFQGVMIDDNAVAAEDIITQPAVLEGEGGVWAIDPGLWVLIGVPVQADEDIVIQVK
ncbi:MAG: hypothetical protein AAF721_03235, partial [Myxococcota bacterium]